MIIATNRASTFLEAAVASVCAQTYSRWEIVIVDDGGPDPEAIDALAARYPNVWVVHQAAAGVSVARNVGVAATTGEYCAFLDDDDVWLPQRLQLQVEALERDRAAVLSYGRVSVIDASGNQVAPPNQAPAVDNRDVFRRSATPQFQAVLIRRQTLTRVGGFHSAIRLGEDLDLILRAAREGSFAFVDAELAQYRVHGNNVTKDGRTLASSLDVLLQLHQIDARVRDDGTDADLQVGRRANRMFAAWDTSRFVRSACQERAYAAAARRSLWAARFAPDSPFVYAWRRLVSRRR